MPDKKYCSNHPHRAAVEYCEVCQIPLCGYCLHYTDDGQRLCQEHALTAQENGLQVVSPSAYSSEIIPSQAQAQAQTKSQALFNDGYKPKGAADKNQVLYHGNNTDLHAFLSMIMGLFVVASCCGAVYCLPFAAFGLGVVALLSNKDAVDRSRARTQAWIGILASGFFVCGGLACIALYMVVIAAGANANNNFAFQTYPAFPTQVPSRVKPTSSASQAPAKAKSTPNNPLEPAQKTATVKAIMTIMTLNAEDETEAKVTSSSLERALATERAKPN